MRFTETGREKVRAYIIELEAKRKEILDAYKDTAIDTILPSENDILNDIAFSEYDNMYDEGWYVTDHYTADNSLVLYKGDDYHI